MGICEIFYTRATREGPFLRVEIGLVGGPLRFLCGVHLYLDTSPLCPSCRQVPETCSHILHCPHEGRVEALHTTFSMLDKWMKLNDNVRGCTGEFSRPKSKKSFGSTYTKKIEAKKTSRRTIIRPPQKSAISTFDNGGQYPPKVIISRC